MKKNINIITTDLILFSITLSLLDIIIKQQINNTISIRYQLINISIKIIIILII